MREQMKSMLDADEARIRADERARCAGMLKFRGFDQAASMVRSDLRCDVPDPIAEARAAAFDEAAKDAKIVARACREQACKSDALSACEEYGKASALLSLAKDFTRKAAAIRAAGRQE